LNQPPQIHAMHATRYWITLFERRSLKARFFAVLPVLSANPTTSTSQPFAFPLAFSPLAQAAASSMAFLPVGSMMLLFTAKRIEIVRDRFVVIEPIDAVVG
jgi:hypothetical protein